MHANCWAYEEDGTICRQPAVEVDPDRGYTVCRRHRPTMAREIVLAWAKPQLQRTEPEDDAGEEPPF